MDADRADGFLARWARRKEEVRSGVAVAGEAPREPAAPVAVVAPTSATVVAPAVALPEPAPLPTLQDVAALTRESDYARFVAPGVSSDVRNAAVKKLFTDPHYNIMDGLDTYIDDYGKPDPLPLAMLRQMNQSKFLGLFDHEDEAPGDKSESASESATASASASASASAFPHATDRTPPTPDDHADLQLQQDDAAGRAGAGPGSAG